MCIRDSYRADSALLRKYGKYYSVRPPSGRSKFRPRTELVSARKSDSVRPPSMDGIRVPNSVHGRWTELADGGRNSWTEFTPAQFRPWTELRRRKLRPRIPSSVRQFRPSSMDGIGNPNSVHGRRTDGVRFPSRNQFRPRTEFAPSGRRTDGVIFSILS